MAIDINNHVETHFFAKWISAGKLKSLLEDVNNSFTLYPNRVGNLTICNSKGEYIGYVDMNEEEIDIFDPGIPSLKTDTPETNTEKEMGA